MMPLNANEAFGQALVKSLLGERGHVPIERGLAGLSLETVSAQTEGLPYSIYQLVSHMLYWQEFLLTYMKGGKPQLPASVNESWPNQPHPEDEEAWISLLGQFLQGVQQAVEYAKTVQLDEPIESFPTETKAGILRNIASHNTYHLGEIVVLRRLHGAWPPPGGGYPA